MIWIYVKQHTVTGLKYFGFTRRRDPFRYNGSGSHWKNHLHKHGKKVNTVEVFGYDEDQLQSARDFAVKFSHDHQIIKDPAWANLKDEDLYLSGSTRGWKHSSETCKKLSHIRQGQTQSPDHVKRRVNSRKSTNLPWHSEATREKMSARQKGKVAYNKGIPMSEVQKIKLSLYAQNKVQAINTLTGQRERVDKQVFDSSPHLVGSTSKRGLESIKLFNP